MGKIFKRTLATIMVVLMVLTSAPLDGFVSMELNLPDIDFNFDLSGYFSVEARAVEYTEGDFVYTVTDGGEATVTRYNGSEKSVVIPDTLSGHSVVEIGRNAFDSSGIKSVEIPDSVTKILNFAFSGCNSLTEIDLPDNVTVLAEGAFNNCTGLTSVVIPKTVTSSDAPFRGCINLKTASFEEGTTVICPGIFRICPGLESVEIPETVTEIGKNAFDSSGIKSIEIPDSVTKILNFAFSGCSSLTEIDLPDNVTVLAEGAFNNCTGLTSVVIPKTVTSSDAPFRGCINLKTASFEEGTTVICPGVFRICPGLESVEIPETVTEIGKNAFDSSGIKNIEIPDSITVIGGSAFAFASLESLDLGAGVTDIGASAFKGTKLTELNIPKNVVSIGGEAFRECRLLESVDFSEGLETIGVYAFALCSCLKSVNLPLSLKTLEAAFIECTSLESVFIPKGIEKCGYASWGWKDCGPFAHCTSLKNIEFEKGIEKIYDQLFLRCTGLKEFTIPETVKEIGVSAFSATEIETVVIPSSVTKINGYAFRECSLLKSVVFSEGLETIGVYAFALCSCLKSVNLPLSLKTLEAAFIECTSLESVFIPKGIEKCGYASWGWKDCGPFAHCTSLKNIEFEEDIEKIYDQLFLRCTGLKEFTIPKTVKEIGVSAFSATELETVVIPSSVTKINGYAFRNCEKLRTVVIPDSVTEIKNDAFFNCANLTYASISDSVKKIGVRAFSSCPELVIYSNMFSEATIHAIENDIIFSPIGSIADNENLVLDRAVTEYYTDTNSMSANGYIKMTVNYKLKESWKGKVSDTALKVILPKNAEFDESTLKLDGVLLTKYNYNGDRVLNVPVSGAEGKLTFSVKVSSQNDLLSYATLSFKRNRVIEKEIIGILSEEVKALTVDAPDTVSQNQIKLSGIAPASADLNLYIDGEDAGTVTASKAGLWFATVTIDDPVDYNDYTVEVQCKKAGETLIQSVNVMYFSGEPELSSFVMKYNEHNVIKECSLDSNAQTAPIVYFLPGTQFDFELEFTNPEEITELYVTSTRNNVTKYLKAEYDEETGAFHTNGYFDENDKNYVPGTISYTYKRAVPEVRVGQDMDWDALASRLPEGCEDYINIIENTEKDCKITVDLKGFSDGVNEAGIKALVSIFDKATDGDLSDWMGIAKGSTKVFSYMTVSEDGNDIEISIDVSDPLQWVMIVRDITGDKVIKCVLDSADKTAESLSTAAKLSDISNSLSNANSALSYVYKYLSIERDMNKLRDEVYSGTYSSNEERYSALKKVDELEYDQKVFELMMVFLPLVAAGSVMSGPAIVFTALLGCISASSSVFWSLRKGQIKGSNYKIKMVIDPSGYVYDIGTNERLEGVKATAYCVEYDESEDFWDNPPADDFYGTVWNAAEYNQLNPMLTNADGKYAWDVPEGWWRVKYEKEGYEITWSEWLPVPPPQTEVNIGMIHTVHSWNTGEVTKAATCTTIGTKTYTCTCGATYTETIAKLGHAYSNACDTTCNTCSAKRTITHSYKNVITKATLTKNGKVENKCSVCGNVKSTTTVYYPKTIKLSATSYTYNGKTKTPTVTVKDSKGNTLKKDTDYTVKYSSGRKSTGKYSVTVTFKGKYSGTKTLYFNILPSKTSKITPTCATASIKASWSKVTGASGYKVELLNSKGKVAKTATTTKTSYTFKKLSKVTTYKVRVTAYKTIDSKKVYSKASTTITTSTAPAKVTLSKATAGSKQATVAWKTVSGASGYEVMYSTSSKFKSTRTATVKKGSSKKTTIKKLTKGKKYYFKVRAYKTVDGKKVYGAWSAVKNVKVK